MISRLSEKLNLIGESLISPMVVVLILSETLRFIVKTPKEPMGVMFAVLLPIYAYKEFHDEKKYWEMLSTLIISLVYWVLRVGDFSLKNSFVLYLSIALASIMIWLFLCFLFLHLKKIKSDLQFYCFIFSSLIMSIVSEQRGLEFQNDYTYGMWILAFIGLLVLLIEKRNQKIKKQKELGLLK